MPHVVEYSDWYATLLRNVGNDHLMRMRVPMSADDFFVQHRCVGYAMRAIIVTYLQGEVIGHTIHEENRRFLREYAICRTSVRTVMSLGQQTPTFRLGTSLHAGHVTEQSDWIFKTDESTRVGYCYVTQQLNGVCQNRIMLTCSVSERHDAISMIVAPMMGQGV